MTPDCLNFGTNFVPYDFLPLVMKAMSVLQSAGKDNIIYHAARCFGEKRPGMDIPRLPLDRMPFGLIAHNLIFFASDDVKFLEAPGDYKSWFQSLYTLFGNKWASMHLGPLWSYELECGDVSLTSNTSASTDILSQALQESFGDDFELLNSSTDSFANDSDVVVAESRENTEDVDEDVSVTNDSVHVGRIIRGDPLQVLYNVVLIKEKDTVYTVKLPMKTGNLKFRKAWYSKSFNMLLTFLFSIKKIYVKENTILM